MNTTKLLLTRALQLSKVFHQIYDSGADTQNQNLYHGRFAEGVNPYHDQTKNSLILEGYYRIHTPLGYWEISGSGSRVDEVTERILRERLGLKLICPGYYTNRGFYSPYWLVTSIDGEEIPYEDIELLPPMDNNFEYYKLDEKRWSIDEEDENEMEFRQYSDDLHGIIPRYNYKKPEKKTKPKKNDIGEYLRVLEKFYKDRKDYIEYNEGNKIFDQYLDEWLYSGLISDTKGYTYSLMRLDQNSDEYKHLLEEFKNHIKPGKREYYEGSYFDNQSRAKKLFKLTYDSGLHSNK